MKKTINITLIIMFIAIILVGIVGVLSVNKLFSAINFNNNVTSQIISSADSNNPGAGEYVLVAGGLMALFEGVGVIGMILYISFLFIILPILWQFAIFILLLISRLLISGRNWQNRIKASYVLFLISLIVQIIPILFYGVYLVIFKSIILLLPLLLSIVLSLIMLSQFLKINKERKC